VAAADLLRHCQKEGTMLRIPMPSDFALGQTADVTINGKPERLWWRTARRS
jgi:hypothetical protein